MTHEIAIACGILGRNNRKPVRQTRQYELLLQFHQSLFLKSVNGLLTLQFLYSEREFRIYIIDHKGKTIQLAVRRLHLDKNRHAFLKRRARHRLEIWRNEPEAGTPYYSSSLCNQSVFVALGKFEITMASASCLDRTDLCLEPEALWKKRFYPLFKSCLKFKKVDKFFLHMFPSSE